MSTSDKLSYGNQIETESETSFEDAAAVGFKVVEMADRVRVLHQITPGSQATWAFEIDDHRYAVVVTVAPPSLSEGT